MIICKQSFSWLVEDINFYITTIMMFGETCKVPLKLSCKFRKREKSTIDKINQLLVRCKQHSLDRSLYLEFFLSSHSLTVENDSREVSG